LKEDERIVVAVSEAVAANTSEFEHVKWLLAHRADPNGVRFAEDSGNEVHSTPLAAVCRMANTPATPWIQLLVSFNADIHRQSFGDIPLHHSIDAGNCEAMQLLLSLGAATVDAEVLSAEDGFAPLHAACKSQSCLADVRWHFARGVCLEEKGGEEEEEEEDILLTVLTCLSQTHAHLR
jgi:hypothetical protein